MGAYRPANRRKWKTTALTLSLALACRGALAEADAASLNDLSIDDLAKIDITSVSKRSEPLSDAAASIFVITHDDIIRSGAVSIPEILRLAPNLLVSQENANSYDITARGFTGNQADQNFPNKLLVLIDGRSVYSPLYSGVYWDMQHVPPETIERIEVISGPGATLWGANAFNGVINIITRGAADTPGGTIELSGGNLGENASIDYGGKLDQDVSYRVYASGLGRNSLDTAQGPSAHDGARMGQGGFRLDWAPGQDRVTLQGDLYRGSEDQAGAPATLISGENVTGRWQHQLSGGSEIQLQAYYDQSGRATDERGSFSIRTFDLDLQQSFSLGDWNQIVWGGGERISWYDIENTPTFLFVPSSARLTLGNLFLQDTVSLTSSLKLVLGVKLEDDPYSGLSPLPTGRLSWRIDDHSLVWAAVSHAIRSPTPFDVDVLEYLGGIKFLSGGADFKPEEVTSYELGYRLQATQDLSFSASGFFNHYNDLRSVEFGPRVFPLLFGNKIEGDTYGIESWASWKALDWWHLNAGLTVQHENLRFKPGSSQLLGVAQQGDDPSYHASFKSIMRLGDSFSWTAELRTVGAQPDPAVPAYTELDSRLAWRAADDLDFSLSGSNLLHAYHQEMTPVGNDRIGRGFTLALERRF